MGKGSIVKQQLNVRVSKATREKIDFLTDRLYGTQAEVIAVAIDRLYQARIAIKQSLPTWQHLLSKGGDNMKCNICGKSITKAQVDSGDATETAHTDCIDDLSRQGDDAYHRDTNEE